MSFGLASLGRLGTVLERCSLIVGILRSLNVILRIAKTILLAMVDVKKRDLSKHPIQVDTPQNQTSIAHQNSAPTSKAPLGQTLYESLRLTNNCFYGRSKTEKSSLVFYTARPKPITHTSHMDPNGDRFISTRDSLEGLKEDVSIVYSRLEERL